MEVARQRGQDPRCRTPALHYHPMGSEVLLGCVLCPLDVSYSLLRPVSYGFSSLCALSYWYGQAERGHLLTGRSDGVNRMRRIVFWAAVIIPITYVSCLLVAFLKCIPFHKQWQIYPEPSSTLYVSNGQRRPRANSPCHHR